MITEALKITIIGMGGVFFFLLMMICALNILRVCISGSDNKLSKIAIAIALAKNKE